MGDLISIIIPVYKVERYLDRCIESIVNQTYKNLEIILVDDGSPDNCPEICDKWLSKDDRIKVIHQKNMGAGAARNNGLKIASGNFISFIDSDDYISPKMYQILYEVFSYNDEVDIVECGYDITKDDEIDFEDREIGDYRIYSKMEAMYENIVDNIFKQLIWNKLYKKKVIDGILFPLGKKIDDEFWTYQVIGKANKLVHIPNKLYAYCQQDSSVMHSLNACNRLQAVEARCQRHEYICRYFPGLEWESKINLWFTIIYQGQLALYIKDKKTKEKIWSYLNDCCKKYPIKSFRKINNLKQRVWLILAEKSLKLTCKIRSCLKIGL